MNQKLKEALREDERFLNREKLAVKEGLAWKGNKLYIPASLRTQILQRIHDVKAEGHFRLMKILHLAKGQF